MFRPESIENKTLIVSCFDWGKGHFSRCISLFLQLEKQGNTLFYLGQESDYVILKSYGYKGEFRAIEGSNLQFSGDGNFFKEAWRNRRNVRKAIKLDSAALAQLQKEIKADYIISDHRYGIRLKTVPSIFVTHQVYLPKKAGYFAQIIHSYLMKRFDSIWIMDNEEIRLAGELSKVCDLASYIGHYSRFSSLQTSSNGPAVAIISGPTAYAEQFQKSVCSVYSELKKPLILISPFNQNNLPEGVTLISDWHDADRAILNASLIVSRNGYSTLMDLLILKKKAVLMPTPGQFEQEYLAVSTKNPDWKIVNNENELVKTLREFYSAS